MSESPPFPNMCHLIACHQFDQIMGWATGTCGTPEMMPASGTLTVPAQEVMLSDGSLVMLGPIPITAVS